MPVREKISVSNWSAAQKTLPTPALGVLRKTLRTLALYLIQKMQVAPNRPQGANM